MKKCKCTDNFAQNLIPCTSIVCSSCLSSYWSLLSFSQQYLLNVSLSVLVNAIERMSALKDFDFLLYSLLWRKMEIENLLNLEWLHRIIVGAVVFFVENTYWYLMWEIAAHVSKHNGVGKLKSTFRCLLFSGNKT